MPYYLLLECGLFRLGYVKKECLVDVSYSPFLSHVEVKKLFIALKSQSIALTEKSTLVFLRCIDKIAKYKMRFGQLSFTAHFHKMAK